MSYEIDRAMIKRQMIVISLLMAFFLFANAHASSIGPAPETGEDSEIHLSMDGAVPTGDISPAYEGLKGTDIGNQLIFDFSFERHGLSDYYAGMFARELGAGGIGRALKGADPVLKFDSLSGLDSVSKFDPSGFDSLRGFDFSRRFDSKRRFDRERELKKASDLSGGVGIDFEEEIRRPDKIVFEMDQEGKEEADIGMDIMSEKKAGYQMSVKRKSYVGLKIALFVVALLILVGASLLRLIPIKLYFFLTILVIVLWNPAESLFITLIIAISALLAPILG